MGFMDELLIFVKLLPKWYWVILGIIGVALIVTNFFEARYIDNEQDKLLLEQGVDTSLGEILVTCNDGETDVYRPQKIVPNVVYMLCGEILNDQTKAYLDSLDP